VARRADKARRLKARAVSGLAKGATLGETAGRAGFMAERVEN